MSPVQHRTIESAIQPGTIPEFQYAIGILRLRQVDVKDFWTCRRTTKPVLRVINRTPKIRNSVTQNLRTGLAVTHCCSARRNPETPSELCLSFAPLRKRKKRVFVEKRWCRSKIAGHGIKLFRPTTRVLRPGQNTPASSRPTILTAAD